MVQLDYGQNSFRNNDDISKGCAQLLEGQELRRKTRSPGTIAHDYVWL